MKILLSSSASQQDASDKILYVMCCNAELFSCNAETCFGLLRCVLLNQANVMRLSFEALARLSESSQILDQSSALLRPPLILLMHYAAIRRAS